jgi:mono/diheme cytochrome c family protein
MRILKIIFVASLIAWGFTESFAKPGIENPKVWDETQSIKPEMQNRIIIAQGGMHHGMGQGHMRGGCGPGGMGHGQGGMGCGGHGRGHHGGMGSGENYGAEGEASAQCPQPRSTAKAPESFLSMTNPLDTNPDNIEKGRLLFILDAQPSCTACHGPNGDGNGMMGGMLTPSPRNFTCKETMEKIPDGQLFWIIKNGSPGTGMMAFKQLKDNQIWQLIHYIRGLAK